MARERPTRIRIRRMRLLCSPSARTRAEIGSSISIGDGSSVATTSRLIMASTKAARSGSSIAEATGFTSCSMVSNWLVPERMMPAAKDILPPGDFRNWDDIEAWAEEIATTLASPVAAGR